MKLLIALVLSIIIILAVSLYPFELRIPSSGIGPAAALFRSLGRSAPWADFLANIAFYAPLGFFGTCVSSGTRTLRLAHIVLLTAAVLSACTELMQYYVGRHVSALDIVANTLGAAIGTLVAIIWLRRQRRPFG